MTAKYHMSIENEAAGRIFHRFERVPDGQRAHARLLILHGYGDHSGRYVHFMQWMAARGVACDAFDFRGHGRSKGPRGYVDRWEDYLDDLELALSFPQYTNDPPFILAHSHGALVLAAAVIRKRIPPPRGCIFSSPWLGAKHDVNAFWKFVAFACDWTTPKLQIRSGLRDEMMSRDPAMVADSRADPLLLHVATPRFYRTAMRAQVDTRSRAREFDVPLLCLAAAQDTVADSAVAEAFVRETSSRDKTFILIPAARHELLRDVSREQTFQIIHDWIIARIE